VPHDDRPKIALISGCSTGIGRATAGRLADLGVVVAAGARDPSALRDLAGKRPGLVHPIAWDVDDAEATRAAVTGTIGRFGRIDVLINNAGYGQMGPLVALDREAWRRQLETNVVGLADASAWAARAPGGMIERRSGRIVNIGSILGRLTLPFSGAYSASKHAVESISDALRMELAPFGIEVVLVEPGPVESAFSDNARRRIEPLLARADTPFEHLRSVVERRLASTRTGAVTAAACAEVIARASLAPRPPPRILVTRRARAALWARRLLTDRMLDALLGRRFGLRGSAPPAR
jgi:NAD(P)-dependent dehydrogenase (short-subunit alcohol dehydrogenase family)